MDLDKTEPIRDWSSRAWNWIRDKLGVGDGPEGQNGLVQWVEGKAENAWDWMKDKIEPIKKPLMVIGGILIMLSPAGPIILVGAAIGGVIEGVRAIKRYFGTRDGVVSAREVLKTVVLPSMIKVIKGFSTTLADKAHSMLGAIAGAHHAVASAIAGTPEAWAKTKADVHEIIKTIFIDFDLVGAMKKAFRLLLRVLDVPMELLTAVLGKIANAWDAIKDKPVEFLKNLLRAIKLAFKGFFKNILKHLAHGITGWLTLQLKGTGVALPTNWLDLGQIFRFVASILGLSVDHVFERIAKKLDPNTVARLRSRFNILTGAWEWIKLVIAGQWAALWEKIKESLSNLGSMLMDTVVNWVVENVVETVTMQLAATADPSGISEIVVFLIDTYRTIKTVVQYMRQILVMMNTMLDAILGIAAGVLQPAAELIESAFDKAMPVVIGFLANLANLGNIAEPLRKGLAAIRNRVDAAIDWLIEKGRGALEFLGGGAEPKPDDTKIGVEVKWTEEGESHRLWIENRNGTPVVMMASDPEPVDDQLTALTKTANSLQDKERGNDALKLIEVAKEKDKQLNEEVDKLVPLLPTLEKKGVPTGNTGNASQIPAAQAAVKAAEQALVASIEAVEKKLGIVKGDFGSEKNPIPLEWPKPRLASYPELYFGPGPLPSGTVIEQKQFAAALTKSTDPDRRTALGNPTVNGKPWDSATQPIKPYVPTKAGQPLPSGKTIGVKARWQVQTGMTIKMDKTEDSEGGKLINELIIPFGFNPDRDFMDGDHVVERQMGGENWVENLWPLNQYKNRSGGSTLSRMKFPPPPNPQKFVPQLKPKDPSLLTLKEIKNSLGSGPIFFRIVSTRE